MSCRHIEPFIVDFARGAKSDQVREDALKHHVLGCPSCAGLIERERAMSAALRRLAESLDEPPSNPHQEEELLAIFDQARTQPRLPAHAPLWAAAAAAALILGALSTWRPAKTPAPADSDGAPPAVASNSPASGGAVVIDDNRIPFAGGPPSDVTSQPAAAADTGDFIPWPGSAAWPPFESGELVRVSLPADALIVLGVGEPAEPDALVQADVLVGQDGFARAIRLVQ